MTVSGAGAGLGAVRGYVEALGGTVDVIARVGDWTIKVG
jgi:chemotaxis protein histidine kinase CheA